MNRRAVVAIARKDLRAGLRNKMVVLPMLLLPAILLVALPVMAGLVGGAAAQDPEIAVLLEQAPEDVRAELASLPSAAQPTAFLLLYLFAPFYLMLPLLIVHVLAADSIAGERERRTLEALVYTPTTDRELFLGKVLGALVPGIVIAWGGFLLYGLVANAVAWPLAGRLIFPNATWLLLALWVAPALATLGLAVMTIVSARAETFQGAYQTGGFLVLPVLLLMIGQFAGAFVLSPLLAFLFGAALWVVAAALLRWGARAMRRAELLARTKG